MNQEAKAKVLYRKFETAEIANMLVVLLDEHKVEHSVFHNGEEIEDFNPSVHQRNLEIHLLEEDSERVDQLIEETADKELDTVEKDYFIFSFNNDELREVLIKAEEWSALDLALAHKLLRERGEPFDKEEISRLRDERAIELAKPKSASISSLVVAYLGAVFLQIIPIVAGIIYLTSKKDDLAGNRVPVYDDPTKKHGRTMILLSIVLAAVQILIILQL